MKKLNEATVTVGDGVVTIERRGQSQLTVANVLGKISKDGWEYIYLDRLVHESHESDLGEFKVEGAVSSIIGRTAPVTH